MGPPHSVFAFRRNSLGRFLYIDVVSAIQTKYNRHGRVVSLHKHRLFSYGYNSFLSILRPVTGNHKNQRRQDICKHIDEYIPFCRYWDYHVPSLEVQTGQ